MMRPTIFVTLAFLTMGLVAACGDKASQPTVESLLQLVPRDADTYTFADLAGLRAGDLDDLVEQLASLASQRQLRDWDIDFRDMTAVVVADADTRDALVILRGQFVAEDVQASLEDDRFRERPYLEVGVWRNSRMELSVAFVADDVIVLGRTTASSGRSTSSRRVSGPWPKTRTCWPSSRPWGRPWSTA